MITKFLAGGGNLDEILRPIYLRMTRFEGIRDGRIDDFEWCKTWDLYRRSDILSSECCQSISRLRDDRARGYIFIIKNRRKTACCIFRIYISYVSDVPKRLSSTPPKPIADKVILITKPTQGIRLIKEMIMPMINAPNAVVPTSLLSILTH